MAPSTFTAMLLVLLTCTLASCSATIVPPARPPEPVPVFVTDYGRHSSLLVPDGAGDLVEYAWGDWDWFAVNKNGILDGVAALFFSHGATLGSRHLDAGPDRADLPHVVGCERLLRLDVDGPRVDALRDELNARLDKHLRTMVYNSESGFSFVRDDEHYAGWHNCNHVTAQWLRELGCEVDGSPFTSKFKLAR